VELAGKTGGAGAAAAADIWMISFSISITSPEK
jgi:hypothetical protein